LKNKHWIAGQPKFDFVKGYEGGADYGCLELMMVSQKQIRWLSKNYVPQGVVVVQG